MATSSIGKPVVLTRETGKRMAEICSQPARKATAPGQPLKLSSAPIFADGACERSEGLFLDELVERAESGA